MAVLGGALLLFAALFSQVGVDTAFIVAYVVLALVAFVLAALGIDPFHRRRTADYREGFWYRVALFVMRHPVPLVTITTALLAGIALIYFTIDLGESGISTLPRDTTAHRAFELISTRFSAISLEEPNQVVVDARDVTTPEVQGAVERLQARLAADAAFGPTSVDVNDAGDLGVLTVPMSDDTRSTVSIEAVQRLRDDYIPAAFAGVDAEALVTGPTAYTVDFNATVDRYTPIVFTFVLSVSFILLMLAFRSVVVPLKSVLMNLLSVGASYGLLVLVFQHGVGNDLLGFQQVERIDAWVPLMMFSILFGLSMDYHVFLLSRIRERFDQTGDNTESVTHGLCSTASIITGAALIMVAVFGGFAMGELTMFQQIGFGLAVAVILDATVIRVILVPATMRLLNTWNWYYPRWLEWLPKLNVEGVPDETPPRPEPATAD
jgi:RND superfamily putative drug exporter